MRLIKHGVIGGLVALASCGGGGGAGKAAGGAAATVPQPAVRTRGSANLILAAEIAGSGANDALQAIRILRPSMLRTRTGTSSDQSGAADIVVYVDGVKLGTADQLGTLPAANVKEIRLLTASDATTRFGTGHPFGALLVQTKQ